jgi:hypothetical protein
VLVYGKQLPEMWIGDEGVMLGGMRRVGGEDLPVGAGLGEMKEE